MNRMTGSHSSSAFTAWNETSSQRLTDSHGAVSTASVGRDMSIGVGQVAQHISDEPLTDEEREQAAYRAGVAMQTWYARFKETGSTQCLDIAYHFLGVQKQLLAGRSAEYVAKLEAERGLA